MDDQYVLYACPTGPLTAQIDAYFAAAAETCGRNPAHDFPPHCTLTNFFTDLPSQVPAYLDCLDILAARPRPVPVVTVTGFHADAFYQGLELRSPWLSDLARLFATHAVSATRHEGIRAKDWLHVSLAYGFDPQHADTLADLADRLIDPWAPAVWELCFYSRNAAGDWRCHASWPLY